MSIRVIFSTGSLWLTDTAYAFELAAEAGYDGIEVMCDERFTTREHRYLNQLSTNFGLPIPVLHTPFSPRLPGWGNTDTELGRVRHTLQLAEKMKAETIVVHLPYQVGKASIRFGRFSKRFPWFSPFEDFRKWLASGGHKQIQKETSVQIAFENMPTRPVFGRNTGAWMSTVEEWSRFHDHLTLDTTHWATWGINPVEPLHTAGERVKHIHLSNYADGREHRLPQSGEVDLAAFLRELPKINFTGTVSVEVQPEALNFDTPKVTRRKMRETLEFCREHLTI